MAAGCWPKDGEGLVKCWDWPGGKERPPLTGPTKAVNCVVFSPDGKLLAAAGQDKIVWVWEVATGRVRYKLEGHVLAVWGVAFSPDGRLLASAGIGGDTAVICGTLRLATASAL